MAAGAGPDFSCSVNDVHALSASPDWLRRGTFLLFLHKGQAIGTLIHGRIALMGADLDSAERTEVLSITVITALGNGAFNALIGFGTHIVDLLF